jgi:hypothetical protein
MFAQAHYQQFVGKRILFYFGPNYAETQKVRRRHQQRAYDASVRRGFDPVGLERWCCSNQWQRAIHALRKAKCFFGVQVIPNSPLLFEDEFDSCFHRLVGMIYVSVLHFKVVSI